MGAVIRNRRILESPPSPDGAVVRVEPADDLEAVAGRLAGAARVEVNFPKFGDGRGYSIGRLLRERYGYRGELRAVGQVARDLLLYMERCGFDSYELREGEDPQEALAAFGDFTEAYQASAAQPLPLFRRRGSTKAP
ncbi:MAG TPA: DUF934 domain-containing protein [Burkholderiales bacterium]|nr:DUF934 domain-containing protein [Burkholderiales bacterium]